MSVSGFSVKELVLALYVKKFLHGKNLTLLMLMYTVYTFVVVGQIHVQSIIYTFILWTSIVMVV